MRIKKIYPSAVNDDFHRHDDIEEPTELGSQYHTDHVCGMKIHHTEKYVGYIIFVVISVLLPLIKIQKLM